MAATVLVGGLDAGSLLADSPVLQRDAHTVAEVASARALLLLLAEGETRLALLGPALQDLPLSETLRRIRAAPATRQVSLLAVLPAQASPQAAGLLLDCGANAVLQQPVDSARLDAWITRLLSVPRRLELRVPVEGQVVGARRQDEAGYFTGLTRNVSSNGMLLASPVPLALGSELDLEVTLSSEHPRFRAVGRLVRQAPEVAWPYQGYGVEFVFVPPDSQEALQAFLAAGGPSPSLADGRSPIRSTIKRGEWIYEVLTPVHGPQDWQAEIRRAQRDSWRPGAAGPYYVVAGASPEEALRTARAFVDRHG